MLNFLKRRTVSDPIERTHDVGGRSLPLRIVENTRAKRLTLRIASGGKGLRVTVPPGLREYEVDAFLERNRDWLEKRLEKFPDQPTVRPGIKIPLRGVPHLIRHEPKRRGTVTVADGPDGPELIVHGDLGHLPRRLTAFLKREAKRDIEPLVAKHTQELSRKARSIRYRDTSSRWGSCSSAGNLSFSWRIMMAPPAVINYLVAHEVAHLEQMNHGPEFWKLCRRLCPDTDRCKAWLQRNSAALQAIDFE